MNAVTALFTVFLCVMVVALPRRLAAIPLLIGAWYSGPFAVVDVGPAHFSVLRILVFVAVIRVLARGERIAKGLNEIDGLLIAWGAVLMLTGIFHETGALMYRAGILWSELGFYFLMRVFVQDVEDIEFVFKVVCVAMIPIALSMLIEKLTGQNLFAILGGPAEANTRDGYIRASGPFSHPILAGTAGATCMLLAAYLWRSSRTLAMVGIAASLAIVFACTSSGPLMMSFFGCVGLAMWMWRQHLVLIRWSALAAVIALNAIMKDPVYFLMARIDLTGSSTGYFRAQLIRSSIEHINEWWLLGTDHTRHWMATGIHANERHTDITNHLLGLGVLGGLPLITVFILILVFAFRAVDRELREARRTLDRSELLVWTLGAVLFAHITNFFSISLFDQSATFFYLPLACVSGIQVAQLASVATPAKPARRRPRVMLHPTRLHSRVRHR